jgi:hypothetical protein
MVKAKSILDEWKDNPLLEQDEGTKDAQKTETLEKQKKQLAVVLKTLLEETQAKLEEYYQTDESLSEDEFLDPEKPYLVTAMIYAVLDEHPEFGGAEAVPSTGGEEEVPKEEEGEEATEV